MSAKHRPSAQHSTFVPRRSGLMEFEPVTVEEARAALDEIDVAMASLINPEYWQKVRRPSQPGDRALTGRSMKWLLALPEEVRPHATMQRFPRIINALSEVWTSADMRDGAFESLLNDKRKGRRGFPIDVERELSTVCLYASALPR
jgi:hypothetical protein